MAGFMPGPQLSTPLLDVMWTAYERQYGKPSFPGVADPLPIRCKAQERETLRVRPIPLGCRPALPRGIDPQQQEAQKCLAKQPTARRSPPPASACPEKTRLTRFPHRAPRHYFRASNDQLWQVRRDHPDRHERQLSPRLHRRTAPEPPVAGNRRQHTTYFRDCRQPAPGARRNVTALLLSEGRLFIYSQTGEV